MQLNTSLHLNASTLTPNSLHSYLPLMNGILYGFNQFVSHASRRVLEVPKFGPCHGSHRGPDERSERDTYHMWYFFGCCVH